VTQLIEHERLETTHPKAKELSRMADHVVQLAKKARHLIHALLRPASKSGRTYPVICDACAISDVRCRCKALPDSLPHRQLQHVPNASADRPRAHPPRCSLCKIMEAIVRFMRNLT
jgi:Ribosomal protein L17